MKALYRFFKSIKLAIVLFSIIAALSAFSTLVPQGREAQFYFDSYSPIIARLIVGTNFHNFFRSILFLLLTGLFFINIAVCTVGRVVRRARSSLQKRFGPDLIHIGILLLMIGGLVSMLGKREGYVFLTNGEYAKLPDGYYILLNSFTCTAYPDGRPKDYVSSVEISKDGQKLKEYDIRVNKPLKIGDMKIFQDSYSSTSSVILRDNMEESYVLHQDEGFRAGGTVYLYLGAENRQVTRGDEELEEKDSNPLFPVAIFEEFEEDGNFIQTHYTKIDERISDYFINDIIITEKAGLRVVKDRGFIPVVIAFIIVGIGLGLTFIQKIGE